MSILYRLVPFVLSILLISSCASSMQGISVSEDGPFRDISHGLPNTGLWRHSIVVFDIDKDGILDIIAPPPRKAPEGQRRPFIFSYIESEQRWKESQLYRFPLSDKYNYGGIAVGDINKDGRYDLVLANHENTIVCLINDGKGSFEINYPVNEPFRSRTVLIDDINGDGLVDIIALSEFYNPNLKDLKTGIMVGINENGSFSVNFVEESSGIFGDSLAVGDINGDGKRDIIIAPLTGIKEQKKAIWLNEGNGVFKPFKKDLFTDKEIPFFVRVGDIDGDGRDEMVFKISPLGAFGSPYLKAFRFTNDNIEDISKGLEDIKDVGVFDLADIDNDGIHELSVLTKEAITLYKYIQGKWIKIDEYRIKVNDLNAVYDLRVARQRDGSVIFVYNLASDDLKDNGIRAHRVMRKR